MPSTDTRIHSRKHALFGTLLLFAVAVLFTIVFYRYTVNIEGPIVIDSESTAVDTSAQSKPVIFIGVISRYPPNIIYSGYQPMLDYLTSRTPYRFELRFSEDYNQAVQMLLQGEVAAAFLGTYVYIQARREHGIIPILKPLNNTLEPFSRSVLFAKGDKKIFNIGDLKGKNLALPSMESYSANWFLRHELARAGMRREDVKQIVNFPHHQSVIRNVLTGAFDAGVTREVLIQKMYNRNIRVVIYSDPFPTSPLVVARGHNPAVTAAITSSLLALRSHPDRESITRGWDTEFQYGFVEATDSDYDIMRRYGQE